MKTTKSVPHTVRRRYPRWVNFLLATTLGVGVGIGQGIAATGGVPGKPFKTKAGAQLALGEATARLLAAGVSPVPNYFGPWPNWANSPFSLPDAIVHDRPPPRT